MFVLSCDMAEIPTHGIWPPTPIKAFRKHRSVCVCVCVCESDSAKKTFVTFKKVGADMVELKTEILFNR